MAVVHARTSDGVSSSVRVMHPTERRSKSRSATRALDLLECFGRERRWLRAVEISRMLGLNASTVNQLLKTMVDSAHLTFDAEYKTYFPSSRLTAFCNLMAKTYDPDDGLHALVRELHLRTGMDVTLSTQNDIFVQVQQFEGDVDRRGVKTSVFGSATGGAFLSTLPDMEIIRLARRAGISQTQVPAILRHVASVRKEGLAEAELLINDRLLWTIGAALPPGSSITPMVIAISSLKSDIFPKRDHMKDVLQSTMRSFAEAHTPGGTSNVSERQGLA